MDKRLASLSNWLSDDLKLSIITFEPASADASFRRYFRVTIDQATSNQQLKLPTTFIVMDSPPEHEDNALFIACTKVLTACNLNVPIIYEKNLKLGFLIISDLGTDVFQQALTASSANNLYSDAMNALLNMQSKAKTLSIPNYSSEKLSTEIQLFDDWYIQHYHQSELSIDEHKSLKQVSKLLIDSALEQPQVLVHRDFHCRNLLVTEKNNPGIIDYQDMVVGPITYDLVSLFKDCYIEWPHSQVEQWITDFQEQSIKLGIHQIQNQSQWLQWFDWMGVQRHLKVLGIFSRLYFRDGKNQYLQDMPLTYHYLIQTCEKYSKLQPLAIILKKYPIKLG